MKSPGMARFLDALSRNTFRMTVTDAHRLGCCVRCRKDVNIREWRFIDQSEYHLSGLCPECYDTILPAEDCE